MTELVTVQANAADPADPSLSVAVTVTEYEPAVVGVPEIRPLVGSIEIPAGRPAADHELMVAVGDESVADEDRGVMEEPLWSDWAPGLATDTELPTVQVKVADPEKPASSVAMMVVEHAQPAVGVPVIRPVEGSIARPVGSPVADQVIDAVGEESVAAPSSGVMAAPLTLDWAPGLVTDTVLVIVQANVVEPLKSPASVAVTVTEHAHAVLGVPLITPVAGSIDNPAGSPEAEYVSVAVDDESVALIDTGVTATPDTELWAPGSSTDTVLVMVQVNDVEPV